MDILRRNNVHVSGRGEQAMVFVHGLGCDQSMWRRVVQAFSRDYKIVLFDYVGSGKSDMKAYDPDRYSTLQGYANDVIEVCDALDLHHAILVAHSVSSMICMLAAIERPQRIGRLVMLCPSPRYLNDLPGYTGGFEKADIDGLLRMIEHNHSDWPKYLAGMVVRGANHESSMEEMEATFCAMDPLVAGWFARTTFLSDSREQVGESTTPTLILHCAEDVLAPPSVAEYLRDNMANSTLRQMDATGHSPHLTDQDETIACIRDFLQQPA